MTSFKPCFDCPCVAQVKAKRDHTATVIWLHGLGGTGSEWTELPEVLHMPWVKFVFPASQPMRLDLWDGQEQSAWFDLSTGTYQVHSNSLNAVPEVISRIYSKIQPDLDRIETSAALVQELVRKVILSPNSIPRQGGNIRSQSCTRRSAPFESAVQVLPKAARGELRPLT